MWEGSGGNVREKRERGRKEWKEGGRIIKERGRGREGAAGM